MSDNNKQKTATQMIPQLNRRENFREVEHANDVKGTLKRIVQYFVKEKMMVFAMLIVVVFGTLCGVYAPSLQSNVVDIISGSLDKPFLSTLILMLIVYLLYSLCTLLQGLISAKLSQLIIKRMREELFSKIIDLPIKYLDTHSHGDVMSCMTNDIETISTTVSQSLPSLFSGILTIIGTVVMMMYYCWQLALLSLATVILTVIATTYLSKKVRRYSRKRQQLLGELNGTVEEMISGYHTVVAYNHQDKIIEQFRETADSLTKAGIRTDVFSGVMGPIMNCIGNIGYVIITAFGGYFALNGMISVGVISAFIVYAKQFSKPINEIAQIYGQLQTAIASAERVFVVMDEENEDPAGKSLILDEPATITFDHVLFAYEKGKPAIQDFTLTVPAGKKIALVGATGSGKTTIVNLLMRFYDIDGGNISINGQNIQEVARDELRKNIAIVLQDTTLFSDTVRNNLLYANDKATQEDLDRAIKLSHCESMIANLPQGYDTVLVNSGQNISQGQRQLLSIARTFVADTEILIFDEATSNVDTRTEKSIQDAMQLVMKNRTSIVIAHRLSTIRDSDIIVVMDHGKIVEAGNHDALLEQKGKYYELYITQYAGVAI